MELNKSLGNTVPNKDVRDSTNKNGNSFGIYGIDDNKNSLSKTGSESRNSHSFYNNEILKTSNITTTPVPLPLPSRMVSLGSRIEGLSGGLLGSFGGGLGALGGGGLSKENGIALGRYQV